MKPIHLNLASRPYRDYRPVYAVVVVMSLLTAVLMLENIDTYYRYVNETQSTRTKTARIEAQAQQERQRVQAIEQRLASLDLQRLDQQTRFVNAKLSERAFSWSMLLDELESVLAADVRLISVTPSFDDTAAVDLKLNFQSKSADGMITTINRMHADPQFDSPFPHSERTVAGGYQFDITVKYIPAQAALTSREVRR